MRRSWENVNTSSRGKYVLRWVQNTAGDRRRMCETFREKCARMSDLQVLNGKSKPNMTVGQMAETWYAPWLDRRVADGKTKDETPTST